MQVPAPFEYERATSVDARARAARAARARGPPAGRRALAAADDEAAARDARSTWSTSTTLAGELGYIREEGGEVRIGAMTRHRALLESELLAERLPIFTDAERVIADPVVRNRGHDRRRALPGRSGRGPVGGLRRASTRSVVIRGQGGERVVGMREFHRGPYETAVGDGEMLIEIRVPLHADAGSAYEKVERRVGDWAVAAAGAAVRLEGGTIAEAGHRAGRGRLRRVDVARRRGGARRQRAVGGAVRGGRAARRRATDPVTDQRGSAEYKRHLAGELTRRALRRATARALRGGELMQVTMTVNGEEHARDVEPRLLLVHFLRDDAGPDRHALGLRHVQLRHVRRAHGRRARQVVHGARRDGRGPRDHDRRGARAGRRARPGAAGLHGGARPAVRLLHAGDDAHRPGAAGPQTRTRPTRRSARRSPARSAAARATPRSSGRSAGRPSTRRAAEEVSELHGHHRGPADRLRPPQAQGGPALHPRPGQVRRRRPAARDAARRRPAQPASRTRGSSRSTPPRPCSTRRSTPSSPARTSRGSGCAWMPTMSADTQAVLATDKVRFQGQEVAFVIADDRYAARDALELIDVEYDVLPGRRQRAQGARRRRAGHPRRQGGQDRQPHLRLGGRRPGGDRRGVRRRRRRRRRRTCSTRARTRRRWRRAASIADFDKVDGKPHAVVHDPGAARAPHGLRARRGAARAQDPRDLAGHRRRLRQQGPHLPGLRVLGRRLDRHRQAGQVDGGPLREPHGDRLRARLRHARRDRRDEGREDPRRPRRRDRRPRRVQRHGAADEVPGRLLPRVHRLLRPARPRTAAVKGVYTNKAPGGVAYACSFRITEAVYLVERMVDVLAHELEDRPGGAAAEEPHPPRAVPVREQDRLDVRLRRLRDRHAQGDGHRRLRRAAPRAGGEARARAS